MDGFPRWQARNRDTIVFASETCAFDLIGHLRARREARRIDRRWPGRNQLAFLFTAHPSRVVFSSTFIFAPGQRGVRARRANQPRGLGRQLAREAPVEADLRGPVPDSASTAARGLRRRKWHPISLWSDRNHYVGRTFIEPSRGVRDFGVQHEAESSAQSLLEGKRVVLIDDSIVRAPPAKESFA